MWRREKSCAVGNRTRAVHPVARCYTDWAIPIPTVCSSALKISHSCCVECDIFREFLSFSSDVLRPLCHKIKPKVEFTAFTRPVHLYKTDWFRRRIFRVPWIHFPSGWFQYDLKGKSNLELRTPTYTTTPSPLFVCDWCLYVCTVCGLFGLYPRG
jgi:hypothetical protein